MWQGKAKRPSKESIHNSLKSMHGKATKRLHKGIHSNIHSITHAAELSYADHAWGFPESLGNRVLCRCAAA